MNNNLLKKYAIYTKNHFILHFIGSLVSQFFFILFSGKVKTYEEIFINPSTYISILSFYIFVTIFDFSFSMIIDRYKRARINKASEKKDIREQKINAKVDISESSYALDQVFEIRNDKDGDYLQVSLGRDGLDVIEIRMKDEKGETTDQIDLTKKQAKFVAEAIHQLAL